MSKEVEAQVRTKEEIKGLSRSSSLNKNKGG